MTTTVAYALAAPGAGFSKCKLHLPELGPDDIEVAVSHCGVCASDLHLVDGDFEDMVSYPHVCGHEIVGAVIATGTNVREWKRGDRAGIGWQNGACLTCEHCLKGEEQHCSDAHFTCCYDGKGGFAEVARSDSRFAYKIPDEIASAEAAPLLCAGHTVFSALRRHTSPGSRVGVLGIGGLGHLAIQFASKMGCKVSALSSNRSKEHEALGYGASEFIDIGSDLSSHAQSLDFLLITTPTVPNSVTLAELMRPFGVLCFAGMVKPTVIDIVQMMGRTLSVSTANAGSRSEMNEMFSFAADHGIRPVIELEKMVNLNEAMDHLRNGQARYRIVLTND